MIEKEEISILVVDDEKPIRDGCTRVLSNKGYDVLTAENGKEALEILSGENISIVLLDLKMPVMSGEEVLAIAGEKYPDIPIIIITGHGTVDTAVECMKKGAYDFVTKPFQIEEFLATVKRAAEKQFLEQKARKLQDENIQNLYDLNLEKSRIKTIINHMDNGVIVTNRNMEVVLHNPAFLRLMEISRDIENPTPADGLIKDQSLLESLKSLQSVKNLETGSISLEIQGGGNFLRAISAPVRGPDKKIVGAVTVLENVTAFKQLDQMKTDFVNMVAHELRSPLVSIRQLNNVILEGLAGPLEEKQADYIGRGLKKTDALLELINDLLEVAKMEAGKLIQHRVPTDIGRIIEETVSLLEARAKNLGISISYSFTDLKPIQSDEKSMGEVFNNLISNAINYSPEGGKVSITAMRLGEYLEICITDNGVGIPEEELPKIFDKFYRVKNPKTRGITGTGLGLSLVKGIIEAHHGSIGVESVPDMGTTFRIQLPIIAGTE